MDGVGGAVGGDEVMLLLLLLEETEYGRSYLERLGAIMRIIWLKGESRALL